MHMADALISPAVGGVMWAASAAAIGYGIHKINKEDIFEDKKIPLMGVAGAFVFAAQMINFAIPGTGSSGHIGGGLLLAAVLGPHAGFLVMSVILAIQAFFFADGGLLALGCNIFNLGFFTCFVSYPLIFKPIWGDGSSKGRRFAASVTASAAGLLMGAFAVVLETVISRVTALPLGTFAMFMLPIQLVIGIVEGLVTASALTFVNSNAPELILKSSGADRGRVKRVIIALACAAALAGGLFSLFASSDPDGLEWSVSGVTGAEEQAAPREGIYEAAKNIQEGASIFSDYGVSGDALSENAGTSLSGLIGSAIVLGIAALIGALLYIPKRRARARRAQIS